MIRKIKTLFGGKNGKKRQKDEAATRIQALFRGYSERKLVESYLEELIADMISAKKSRDGEQNVNNEPIENTTDSDDESVEEIIVVLDNGDDDDDDDDENDEDNEETVVEIVTIVDDEAEQKPPPPPPTEFERYNQQLKNQGTTSPTTGAWKKKYVAKPATTTAITESIPSTTAEGTQPVRPPPKRKELTPPWMKQAAIAQAKHYPDDTEVEKPPPKAQPKHKSALVNRYLAAAAGTKSDDTTTEAVENDRAKGRRNGKTAPNGITVSQPSNPTSSPDTESSLATDDDATLNGKGADETKDESDEDENYDETKGLPLWWMKLVPHATKDQDDYEQEILADKKENPIGDAIVEYRLFGDTAKKVRSKTKQSRGPVVPLLPIVEDTVKDSMIGDSNDVLFEGGDTSEGDDELDFLPLNQPLRT